MNHIFVDYENIKTVDPAAFEIDNATFTLLFGPQNRKLDAALVESLLCRAPAVELVRLNESGRNAVDFGLAYYLGKKVAADPTAQFHLISKDTGYDPLIEHLRSRNVRINRYPSFEALAPRGAAKPASALKPPAPAIPAAGANGNDRVVAYLKRNESNRPRRKATLVRHLRSQLLRGAGDEEVNRCITILEANRQLTINEKGTVTYHLDGFNIGK